MSGYQFLRMAAYSMVVPKLHARAQEQRRELGKEEVERKLSVEEICYEAGRVPGNHPHVVEAQTPTLLFGMAPEAIPQWLQGKIDKKNEEIAALKRALRRGQRRSGPRAIRKDTPVLIGIVGSHPYLIKSDGTGYPSLDDPQKRKEVEKWVEDWIQWKLTDAAARGAIVVSIVAHTDEAHYHLHAFEISDGLRLEAREGHPGYAAKRAISPIDGETEKETAARGNYAYREAMVAWQDGHHRLVGAPNGLLRVGPRRRRLSRPAYQQEKKAAAGMARLRAAEEEERSRIDAAASIRASQTSAAEGRLEELRAEVASLKTSAEVSALDAVEAEERRDGLLREVEIIRTRAQELVIDLSERKNRLEAEADFEERRLQQAGEILVDLQARVEQERLALATAEEAKRIEMVRLQEAASAREEAQRRATQLDETCRVVSDAGYAMEADLKAKKAEQARLAAALLALKDNADIQRAAMASEEGKIETARLEWARREKELCERESCLHEKEQGNHAREAELDGKLEGLDAFLDGRVIIRDKENGPRLTILDRGDEALYAKIQPVAGWLKSRLLPLHRARSLALALAEAVRAWSKGLLSGVNREHPTAAGEPGLVGCPAHFSPEGREAILQNRTAVAELVESLPNLSELAKTADEAEALKAYLPAAVAAKAARAKTAIDDLDWPPQLRGRGAGVGD